MKILLKYDIPVAEKHQLTKGKVLEVLSKEQCPIESNPYSRGVWVMGAAREPVKICHEEYRVIV